MIGTFMDKKEQEYFVVNHRKEQKTPEAYLIFQVPIWNIIGQDRNIHGILRNKNSLMWMTEKEQNAWNFIQIYLGKIGTIMSYKETKTLCWDWEWLERNIKPEAYIIKLL